MRKTITLLLMGVLALSLSFAGETSTRSIKPVVKITSPVTDQQFDTDEITVSLTVKNVPYDSTYVLKVLVVDAAITNNQAKSLGSNPVFESMTGLGEYTLVVDKPSLTFPAIALRSGDNLAVAYLYKANDENMVIDISTPIIFDVDIPALPDHEYNISPDHQTVSSSPIRVSIDFNDAAVHREAVIFYQLWEDEETSPGGYQKYNGEVVLDEVGKYSLFCAVKVKGYGMSHGYRRYEVREQESDIRYFDKGNFVWGYYFLSLTGHTFFLYTIDGEQELNGKTYKKVYSFDDCEYERKEENFVGLFREQNQRIYAPLEYAGAATTPIVGDEIVLYDFSLQVGDHFGGFSEEYPHVVEKIDTILIDGEERKVFHFNSWSTWIEGIGSLDRTFFSPLSEIPTCLCNYVLNLFNVNDSTVYVSSLYGLHAGFKSEDCAYKGPQSPDNILTSKALDVNVTNDSQGSVLFELPDGVVCEELCLYDVNGKMVRTIGETSQAIRVEGLNAGFYYYVLRSGGRDVRGKVGVR